MATVIPFDVELSPASYSRFAEIIARGGVAAVPTESSYALAVSPFRDEALRTLVRAKGRPEGKPILVLIGDLTQMRMLVETIPPAGDLLVRSFWPGPLTIIFPARPSLPCMLTAGTGTVGLRLPAMLLLRQLLLRVGPLTGTSANRSDKPPLCAAEEVLAELDDDVDVILDAGPTAGGIPSTVLDARSPIRVLREGPVSRAALTERLHRAGFELSP